MMMKYFIHDITLSLTLNQSQSKKNKLKNLIKISLIVDKKKDYQYSENYVKKGEANDIATLTRTDNNISFRAYIHGPNNGEMVSIDS